MMKKYFLLMLIAFPLTCFFTACGNDDEDEGEVVVVNEDGTTSNRSVFLRIDDKNFCLDYVKYTIASDGNLVVSGYNEWQHAGGVANIYPNVSVSGHTYKVASVTYDAFKDCRDMTSVIFPPTIRFIGECAFYNCSGLKSLFIPKSVDTIGELAFSGCGGLENITVEEGNENFDSRNNCNAIISKKGSLIKGCENTVIPDNVLRISMDAFRGCTGLNSINIPNTVTSIEQSAFEDCSGLTSIIIPNSAYQIGSFAFQGCNSLTSVTISNSIEIIGNKAFSGCTSLTSIHCKATNPSPAAPYSEVFDNSTYSSATLYIPRGSLDAYRENAIWSRFKNIVEE